MDNSWEDEWLPPPLIPQTLALPGIGWLAYARHEAEVLRQWNRDLLAIRQLTLKQGEHRNAHKRCA